MPDPATIERLRGLVLSAAELRVLTEWPDALIEDYLNIVDNFITLAELLDIEIDQTIEEISTDFTDGSIPFADNGLLIEENPGLVWDNINKILTLSGGLITGGKREKNEIRITSGDSPYTVLPTDHIIICATDGGAIEVDYPAGTSGRELTMKNVGTSGNDITLDPNGIEEIFSGGAGVAFTVYDGEVFDTHFNAIEGWF